MRVDGPALAFAACAAACGGGDTAPWQLVHQELPGALLSVWGTSATDVWAVGADARDGRGPLALHYDGTAWTRLDTGRTQGDLWWIFGFADGPVFAGGDGGVILRYEGGAFTPMSSPGTATVFGIWGASPTEMWAVGGASESSGGFAWRLQGDAWIPAPTLPTQVVSGAALWKVFGRSATDVELVGSNGVSLHWDGTALREDDTGVGSSLFTVHANANRYAAVGGLATGIIVEHDGAWVNRTPNPAPFGLAGVSLGIGETGFAVGQYGTVLRRDAGGWHPEDVGFYFDQNLHSVWIDPDGGVWAVGGQTFSRPLTDGVLIHEGSVVSGEGL